MVSFTCDGCQEAVKKPKLLNHYHSCRYFTCYSCIDCFKSFYSPDQWAGHTSCITEAEKWHGEFNRKKGPQGPQGQKQQQQQQQKTQGSSAVDTSKVGEKRSRDEAEGSSSSVTTKQEPAKRPKKVEVSYSSSDSSSSDSDSSSDSSSSSSSSSSDSDSSSEDESPLTKDFFTTKDWRNAFKSVLEDNDSEMPLKKLKKKAVKNLFAKIEDQITTQLTADVEKQTEKIKADPKIFKFKGKKVQLKKD